MTPGPRALTGLLSAAALVVPAEAGYGPGPVQRVGSSAPDTVPESAVLIGTVTDTGSAPLSRARVEILTTGLEPVRSATTPDDGEFRLDSLPELAVYVVARARGYVSDIRGPVYLSGTDTTTVSFRLRVRRARPDTVSVSLSRERHPRLVSAGFYQRRASTAGEFMTGPEIRESGASSLSRLLSELVAGAEIVRSPAGDGVVLPGGQDRIGSRCYPLVFVDGTRVGRAGPTTRRGGAVSLNSLVNVDQLLGIEVYGSAAEIPGSYAGTESRCGVILLWTASG